MNRYRRPSLVQRAAFAAVAVVCSVITLGSLGGLAGHYAGAAVPKPPQEMAMAARHSRLR